MPEGANVRVLVKSDGDSHSAYVVDAATNRPVVRIDFLFPLDESQDSTFEKAMSETGDAWNVLHVKTRRPAGLESVPLNMLQPVDLAGPPEAAVCDAERDLREIVGRMRRRKASGDYEYVRDVAYLMGLAGVDHFRPDVPGEG